MKKNILTIATLILANVSIAQWTNKKVDNGFDEPYKICYTAENNGAILKLENVDGEIAFYLQGGYFCDDAPVVNISFLVNNVWIKYTTEATKGEQSNALFLVDDMNISDAIVDFVKATSVKIRVNESHCATGYYQFNMSGSTSAYNFIKN
jgi:hypothetical protein